MCNEFESAILENAQQVVRQGNEARGVKVVGLIQLHSVIPVRVRAVQNQQPNLPFCGEGKDFGGLPDSMSPMPNWSWEWRGKWRSEIRRNASTPASSVRKISTLCIVVQDHVTPKSGSMEYGPSYNNAEESLAGCGNPRRGRFD